jgi:hypothetical protein
VNAVQCWLCGSAYPSTPAAASDRQDVGPRETEILNWLGDSQSKLTPAAASGEQDVGPSEPEIRPPGPRETRRDARSQTWGKRLAQFARELLLFMAAAMALGVILVIVLLCMAAITWTDPNPSPFNPFEPAVVRTVLLIAAAALALGLFLVITLVRRFGARREGVRTGRSSSQQTSPVTRSVRLPRMTTQRWMIAVALVATLLWFGRDLVFPSRIDEGRSWQPTQLTFVVSDADSGHPIEGALVELRDPDRRERRFFDPPQTIELTTGPDGRASIELNIEREYEFDHVSREIYDLHIQFPRWEMRFSREGYQVSAARFEHSYTEYRRSLRSHHMDHDPQPPVVIRLRRRR